MKDNSWQSLAIELFFVNTCTLNKIISCLIYGRTPTWGPTVLEMFCFPILTVIARRTRRLISSECLVCSLFIQYLVHKSKQLFYFVMTTLDTTGMSWTQHSNTNRNGNLLSIHSACKKRFILQMGSNVIWFSLIVLINYIFSW